MPHIPEAIGKVMKKSMIALTALMALGGATASAQQTTVDVTGLTVKLGTMFPLDDNVSSVADSFLSLGLEWQGGPGLTKFGEGYLSFDYYGRSLSFKRGSASLVTFNQRIYKESTDPNRTYVLFGGGLGFLNFGSAETVFVGRAGVGKRLSDHSFVEAVGTLSSPGGGVSFNTLGLYFGYKF
jgi:hypothetical protein